MSRRVTEPAYRSIFLTTIDLSVLVTVLSVRLGAAWPRAFWAITLPQIRLPVMSGALLAFISSFEEVIVSFFISGGAYSTLPRRMFNALRRDQIEPTIAAISTILVVLSVGTVVLLEIARRPARQP